MWETKKIKRKKEVREKSNVLTKTHAKEEEIFIFSGATRRKENNKKWLT